MRRLNKYFTILVFIFLYIPMVVLAVASFSEIPIKLILR